MKSSLRFLPGLLIAIFLICSPAGVSAQAALPEALPAASPATASSLNEQRKAAAARQRRIIFNNDGGETAVLMKTPGVQEFLDQRTSMLADTQVDSIFYCTRSSGFGVFTHLTKVGQVFTTTEGRYAANQTPAFLKAGIDPLRLITDFCRQHKMEVFWSMRMNDTHDGSRTDYGPVIFRANTLKQAHPEYLLGTEKKRPKIGAWTAVNYGLPEIRELAFRYIEEVCRDYDVDGIELDFYRHPVFFKSTSRGELATDEDRAQMTELLHRIRVMADEAGRARGRPILIGVHAPDSADYCRAIGLDLERWMTDDLLDLWIAGGTFHLNAWESSVALARKHGVKIYPSLDDPRIKEDTAREMRLSPATYRARAAQVWAAGADGVYTFNFFDMDKNHGMLWKEMGDPQALAKLDQDYFASFLGLVKSAGGTYPLEPFMKLPLLDPLNKKALAPGASVTAPLNVAGDFSQSAGTKFKLRLRFLPPLPEAAALRVSINDHLLATLHREGEWFDGSVSADQLHPGDNPVRVSLAPEATQKTAWADLLLEVRP